MERSAALVLACLLSACGPRQASLESAAAPAQEEEAPAPSEPRPDERVTPAEAVEQSILTLFMMCELGNLEKAAGYVVYRGDDPERRWKSVCTLGTEEESEAVEEVCGAIREMLASSDSYATGAYETETESEGTWHIMEVIFTRGDETQTVIFAFLEIDGVYALGDID
jgi:hypothetical protein